MTLLSNKIEANGTEINQGSSLEHQFENPYKQKHVDKWWKLKGKGIDTGKIHLGLHRLGLH